MNDAERTGDYQPGGNDEPAALAVPATHPQHIGRYRIEKLLGQGGFGLVYLAHDDHLQRLVAIKVPNAQFVVQTRYVEDFVTEARTIAHLDHPNIVPVYDVGSTEQFYWFIVSKYIDGTDLATKLEQSRLAIGEAVELMATVAEVLHHAHKHGLVHRDIKPGNILLDKGGKPFVGDFGLALQEKDVGKGPRYAGTPAYMSPEQARGEGHRVDGRSDIFSLGVVFYELLVGRQPFRGESQTELMEQVTNLEARPPRQYDDRIPKELDRICLKALSKRASERYSTAKDMADDLRHFQRVEGGGWRVEGEGAAGPGEGAFRPSSPSTVHLPPATPSPSTLHPPPSTLRIVPKGLRSFDEHDADFFLELLPGPRDRDGLPDSLRFWKTRVEERDGEKTFSVGLICGPSGCGKSSLVKAGLLPRLSEDILAVYVEATAEETETRLLNGLRKRCALLPDNLGLKATLSALRHGEGIPVGKKVVIVLDQFEQWLHAKPLTYTSLPQGERGSDGGELVQALRQCDGGRVQCIVMVRDDFWMAVIRFMRELEVRLLEGQNSAAVDLFDFDHARKVLAAFGRAFGKLPENSGDASKDQKEFLIQAVSGLAQEGKVVSVRLALFAEMMKGKAWTPASLKAVGGTEGVGVTFLEETFSAATAPPEHRYHQKAARAALQALLPETGSDIKGHMRSYEELLEASGYGSRRKDFDDLVRILDHEIRLITPTDPEGVEGEGWRVKGEDKKDSPPSTRYYQLTHDYLVHSIRDWLTRKQKETRRGRAELLLADRAEVWKIRPEKRLLPGWWEWLNMRLLTRKRDWTPTQRQMMRKAFRYRAMRTGAFLLLAGLFILLFFLPILWWGAKEAANDAVDSIAVADTTEVLRVIKRLDEFERYWADPILRERLQQSPDSKEHLHFSLALLPVDSSQVEYLSSRLLAAEPNEVPVIRDALAPYKEQLVDRLWDAVATADKGKESQRLRAAAALAKYDPHSAKWATAQEAVGNDLVAVPALHLSLWLKALRPVRTKLLPQLSAVYRDSGRRETERSLATDIIADYAADNPQVLADLLMDADDKQFAAIYPKLTDRRKQGLPLLTGEIDKKLPPDLPSSDVEREKLAKRQANAAVALLRMNQPEKVWALLKHSPDPRLRSYLIHRLSPMGASAESLIKRLHEEPDITVRRALLLGLGEFNEKELPPASRTSLLPKLQTIYRTDADPGLHAAAEWLLRGWKQEAWLKQVNDEWAKEKVKGEGWWVEGKHKDSPPSTLHPPPFTPRWFVNGQGQTMVVMPGPVEFVMGSPTSEAGRGPNENQHQRRIGRTFALAAKSVTLAEYQRFDPAYGTEIKQWAPTGDCPVLGISWFQAAAYCNWLSKQEGLPQSEWCYVPLQDPKAVPVLAASSAGLLGSPQGPLLAVCGLYPGRTDPEYKVGMELAANYLKRSGYRLPTETEIEFATRAGSVTSRYYGEAEELLPRHAWYNKNGQDRAWPVGSKKPNDFGLFDAHGNVFTWCQDRIQEYPNAKGNEAYEDKEDMLRINLENRVLRGGSFDVPGLLMRSAFRNGVVPTYRSDGDVGLRPARTLRLGSVAALPATAEGSRNERASSSPSQAGPSQGDSAK